MDPTATSVTPLDLKNATELEYQALHRFTTRLRAELELRRPADSARGFHSRVAQSLAARHHVDVDRLAGWRRAGRGHAESIGVTKQLESGTDGDGPFVIYCLDGTES
jgi:hypothetical protein